MMHHLGRNLSCMREHGRKIGQYSNPPRSAYCMMRIAGRIEERFFLTLKGGDCRQWEEEEELVGTRWKLSLTHEGRDAKTYFGGYPYVRRVKYWLSELELDTGCLYVVSIGYLYVLNIGFLYVLSIDYLCMMQGVRYCNYQYVVEGTEGEDCGYPSVMEGTKESGCICRRLNLVAIRM